MNMFISKYIFSCSKPCSLVLLCGRVLGLGFLHGIVREDTLIYYLCIVLWWSML